MLGLLKEEQETITFLSEDSMIRDYTIEQKSLLGTDFELPSI